MIKRSIAFLITMYRIIIITTKKTLVKGGNQAQRDGHLPELKTAVVQAIVTGQPHQSGI